MDPALDTTGVSNGFPPARMAENAEETQLLLVPGARRVSVSAPLSSREPLAAAPASVRSLTPAPSSATVAPARSKPPPKPVRPSVPPAVGVLAPSAPAAPTAPLSVEPAAPASVRPPVPLSVQPAAPPSVRSGSVRPQPPPKPARPSLTPAPSVASRPSATPPPPSVASRPSATPPPPPSRRAPTPSAAPGAVAKPYVSWPRREAARVSIVKSSTEPGLFYVRVLEDGKQPFEGIEGLLVALDAEATLRP